jgi:hypothetical protein
MNGRPVNSLENSRGCRERIDVRSISIKRTSRAIPSRAAFDNDVRLVLMAIARRSRDCLQGWLFEWRYNVFEHLF